MKKTSTTIEQMKEQIEHKRYMLEYLEEVENDIEYYKVNLKDKDGENVLDEDGKPVLVVPTKENRWEYRNYMVKKTVQELIIKYLTEN